MVKQLKGVQKLLEEQNFYFSYYSDLTNSQERQSRERMIHKAQNQDGKRSPFWWRMPKLVEDKASHPEDKQEEEKN